MRRLETDDLQNLALDIPLEGPYKGQTFTTGVPASLLWDLYDTFQRLGSTQALSIIAIDQTIRAELRRQQIPENEITLHIIWAKLADLLDAGKHVPSDKPSANTVLGFTYHLLRGKTITYNQAADIARVLLEDSTITPDAWRKRIARYVTKNDLDAVGSPRGRPKKKPDE